MLSRTLDHLSTVGEALGLTVSNETKEINRTLTMRKDTQLTIAESNARHEQLQALEQTRIDSDGEHKAFRNSAVQDFKGEEHEMMGERVFSPQLQRSQLFNQSQGTQLLDQDCPSPDFKDEHVVRDDMIARRPRMNLHQDRDPQQRIIKLRM